MSTSLVDKTPLRQVATVKQLLANQSAAGQLAAVAASHLNPERMMRTLALSVSKTPKLAECTPMSLLGAMMTSASLGLEPNTPLGLAYLIPFEDRRNNRVEAQLVIGYRGYIQLGHNSRQIASLDAAVHYSDDPVWKWRRGSNAVLEHEQGDMAGEIQHAYAIFEKVDGGKTWIVWPEAKLAAHRDRYSKGYAFDVKRGKKPTDANVNIWLSDPALARMKTMIRQIAKVMPMSSEVPRAAAYDGARADYAGFAMDPGLGAPTIEEHSEDAGSEIDGVVEEERPAIEQRQDQTVPAETGREAIAETVTARVQARAGAAAPNEQPPQGAAATDAAAAARAAAQERARAAVAKRAEQAAAPAAEPTPAAPEADDARAKYQGWADRIRLDIGDLGAAALDDWRDQMAQIEANAPDLAAEIRAYAEGGDA